MKQIAVAAMLLVATNGLCQSPPKDNQTLQSLNVSAAAEKVRSVRTTQSVHAQFKPCFRRKDGGPLRGNAGGGGGNRAAPREYEEPDLEAYDVDFGHTPPQP